MTSEPIKDEKIIQEMFEALGMKKNGFVYQLYFEFALSTGLRVSDILALKKKDIQNGIVKIKTQKTGLYRNIGLNDSCRKQLEVFLKNKKDEDLIFPYQRQWIHKLLKEAAEMVGIDKSKISTHTTRKTAGWFFYMDSGKDIVKTQNFLGHRDPKETLAYLMISDDEVNETLVQRSWRI
ncbi:tyrosine-type recombinase/integrase [Peribacillus sp. NPDC096448]|uniref:tyrosine-type recombinase/integrase n=1 Tax=Peribacillus sp. NPDC096448 TaxID=3364395 RepID=UPI0037F812F3